MISQKLELKLDCMLVLKFFSSFCGWTFNIDNFYMSIFIWSIWIACQRGQDFDNFCMSIKCCSWIGVIPISSGALGLSVRGAKILTISVCPLCAALWIGVIPPSNWRIRIVCQRNQDFDNFCISIRFCSINWSIPIVIWCIRIVCQRLWSKEPRLWQFLYAH